jgi:hypothetical protein
MMQRAQVMLYAIEVTTCQVTSLLNYIFSSYAEYLINSDSEFELSTPNRTYYEPSI